MPTAVRSRHGVRGGDHVVEFYERDAALAESVAGYLAGPLRAGGSVIVIATEAHRRAFARQLAAVGAGPLAVGDRAVVWLDAAEVLASVTRAGRIDGEAFRHEVGCAIAKASALGGPVCVYGEMVQLLWDAGKVVAALDLEGLWNEVIDEQQCSLMCAYRGSSVFGAEHSEALQRVCELHSSVLHAPAGEVVQPSVPACSRPLSVRGQRLHRAGLYRKVAATLERSAELAEQHAEHERRNGRQFAADVELQRAKRAREAAHRARAVASRLR